MTVHSRQIHLASRPHGTPDAENFRLVEVDLPDPGDGQVVVRNQFMSVDPYMRGRMNDVKSYVAPFALGACLDGGAVGEVIASNAADVGVGTVVLSNHGWRDVTVVDARHVRPVDLSVAGASHYLGALGVTGMTAYVGLTEIAGVQEGDVVFVSAAAGAVGSLAGQLARLLGASRVVGSAGSAAKVSYVEKLGYDAAFDYHSGPVRDSLEAVAPDGIDVYFDNVGGEHLEAAISSLRTFGRVALCGAISAYNATTPPAAPRNLALAIGRQLTLRGFIVSSYERLRAPFLEQMSGWIRSGSIRFDETIVDGLEHAPDAFLAMLRGDNIGKMIVRLSS
jgi:NADPH-dependent curcumin reductase CurA